MAIITLSNKLLGTTLKFDSISNVFIFTDSKGKEIVFSYEKAKEMVALDEHAN